MQLTDTSLVLIAIMPKLRDMEIARVLGWYRIPMKTAPKILMTDYIAFYQTKDFGEEHKSRIEKYAEVRGVELLTRQELFRDEPDHPRAKEEYYKIQIGPLQTLENPILADRWKRFLFFYTSGEKMFTASTLHDLAITGSEREILWKSLRERRENDPEFFRSTEKKEEIPEQLMFLLGNLTLSYLDFNE
jgi:hypothetical protein